MQSKTTARHEWISVAAYYKSERRGFAPGRELDDWLIAEKDYADMLIAAFLTIAEEDGGMTLSGLRQLAAAVGVSDVEHVNLQAVLIRAIQDACKERSCYQSENAAMCQDRGNCLWKSECKKMIAVWKR